MQLALSLLMTQVDLIITEEMGKVEFYAGVINCIVDRDGMIQSLKVLIHCPKNITIHRCFVILK